MLEEKQLTHEVVRAYLQQNAPEEVEAFDVVFADVYPVLRDRLGTTNERPPDDAIPFDDGFLAGTLVTIAVQIALPLVRAALRDAAKRDLPAALDHLEKRLALATKKPDLVHSLRKRIEAVVQAL